MKEAETVARRLAILAATVVALTLAACGGGGGDGASSAPAPAPPPPGPGPGGDLSTTVATTTYASGSAQELSYQALNTARLSFGSGSVAQHVALDQEVQSQADYILATYLTADSFGGLGFADGLFTSQPDGTETSHDQLPGSPGFVGYTPADRATHFGYPSAEVAESAAFPVVVPTPSLISSACVQGLLASPGHRELLLDPRFRDLGIGVGTASQPFGTGSAIYQNDCYVATAAESYGYGAGAMATAPADWVGLFPADGVTVSSTGDGHGHGFAPSVTVDSHYALLVTSFTITDGAGASVPVTLNLDALSDPQFKNWSVATPTSTLATSTTYTVHFDGSYNGGSSISKTWTFTTPAQ